MSKGTTIKEALQKFEDSEKCKASETKKVCLYGQIPPVEKMDASLSTLVACEHLALSTNCIEKIANLNGLKNLKILSLGRNSIKSLTGLEAVGDTLEELWISYNLIEKLKGINVLKKLRVLYITNNRISDIGEFNKMKDLPNLEELCFINNPLGESWWIESQDVYIANITRSLRKLKRLDGNPVIREEDDDQQQQQ